jgi:predicted nucleic acid-binding protein
MRLHLDTSFLVDWQRDDPRVADLVLEILAGEHEVSIDPIAETEFLAALVITRRKEAILRGALAAGRRVDITPDASAPAARWLAGMDPKQRRAHFADALIAAVASTQDAQLVTSDAILQRLFPVAVRVY